MKVWSRYCYNSSWHQVYRKVFRASRSSPWLLFLWPHGRHFQGTWLSGNSSNDCNKTSLWIPCIVRWSQRWSVEDQCPWFTGAFVSEMTPCLLFEELVYWLGWLVAIIGAMATAASLGEMTSMYQNIFIFDINYRWLLQVPHSRWPVSLHCQTSPWAMPKFPQLACWMDR